MNKSAAALVPTPLECIIAGSISGSAGVLVCHPMDVIRTHMQTSSTPTRSSSIGVVETFSNVVRSQGILHGLYRGIVGPFFAQALYKSLIFTSNSVVSNHMFTNKQRTNTTIFTSGVIAGSVNALVVAPVELIRTRQILATTPNKYGIRSSNSIVAVVRDSITQGGGVQSLWRGLLPAMLRDGPGIGLYLLTFEFTKSKLLHMQNNSSNKCNTDDDAYRCSRHTQQQQQQQQQPLWCKLIAGSFAGIAFWLWALPLDTMKANIEAFSSPLINNTKSSSSSSSRGMMTQQMKLIWERGGIGFLFRAWPVAFGRGIPSAAITLTTFDVASEWLVRHR